MSYNNRNQRGRYGASQRFDGPRQKPNWADERKYCKCSDCGKSFLIKWDEYPEGKYMNLFKEFCDKSKSRTLFIKAIDCPNCTPDSLWDLRNDIEAISRSRDSCNEKITMSNTLAIRRLNASGKKYSQLDVNRERNEIRKVAQQSIDLIEKKINDLKTQREPRIEQYKQLSEVRDRKPYNNTQKERNIPNYAELSEQCEREKCEELKERVEGKIEKIEEHNETPKESHKTLGSWINNQRVSFMDIVKKEAVEDDGSRRLGMAIPTKPCGMCGLPETKAFSVDNQWLWLCKKCTKKHFAHEENKPTSVTIVNEVDSDEEVEDEFEIAAAELDDESY